MSTMLRKLRIILTDTSRDGRLWQRGVRVSARRIGAMSAVLAMAAALLASPPGPALAQVTSVCSRTDAVEQAILAAVSESDCDDVTGTDLAGITSLDLSNLGITGLSTGDFDNLTGLTKLYLNDNELTSLAADVFTTPDERLTDLDLSGNEISSVPNDFFLNFTALERLWLFDTGDDTFLANFFSENTTLQTNLEEVYFGAGTGYDTTSSTWVNRTKPVDFGGLTYNLQADPHTGLDLPDRMFTGMTSLTHLSLNRTGIQCLPSTIPSTVTHLLLDDGAQSSYSSATSGRARSSYPACNANPSVELHEPPTAVSASASPTSSTEATVTWTTSDPNTEVTGFKLRYRSKAPVSSTASDGAWSNTTVTNDPITRSAKLAGLLASTAYEVQVAATTSAGDSAWSQSALVRTYAGVCGRTKAVRDAIVAAVDGVTACGNVTGAHLGAITTLSPSLSPPPQGNTALAAGDFADLTALTTLHLSGNALTSLPAGVFDPLVSLSVLELGSNRLTGLPATIFANNAELVSLRLDSNRLTGLPATIFANNAELVSLRLDSNRLTGLPATIFANNTELVSLRLDANEITALPAALFDNNTKLTHLRLTGNRLTTLPAGIFDDSSAITHLALNHNRISSLPRNVFDGLTDLDTLALSDNALTSLPAGVFDRNTKLEELALSGNAVTLGESVFANNTALERLYLGGFWYRGASGWVDYRTLTSAPTPNSAQWIRRARYVTLDSKQYALDASPTDIAPLPNGIFSGLTSLTHLSLDHLGLTCLPTIPLSVTHLMLDAVSNWTLTDAVPGRAASTYPPCSESPRLLSAPSSVSATATGFTTATVSWTAPSSATGLTGYRVRYRDKVALGDPGNDGTWTLATATASETSKALTGLSTGTVYEVQVASVSGAGNGTWTASATTTTESVCTRTAAIADEIVAAVDGKTKCKDIVETDLPGITGPFNLASNVPTMPVVASLKAGDFDGLTGLTSLDLSGNGIPSLPAGIFDDLTALTTLRLSHNRLSALPAAVFDNNTELEILWLFNNALTSLPANVFDENTELQTLWLFSNDLASLNRGIFDNNTKLVDLSLFGNELVSLPEGVFTKNTALTEINLVANRLRSLPAEIFDDLMALTTLLLNVNELSSLSSDVFDKNENLLVLGLANNRLTSLPSDVFKKNTKLTSLFLAGNQLTELDIDTFRSNTKLLQLDISGNRLTSLPETLLSANEALTSVHLHNPGLTELPSILLSSNKALTAVYLGGFWHQVPMGFPGTSTWRKAMKPVTVRGVEYAFEADPASITDPPTGLFSGLASLTHVSLDRSGMLCMPTLNSVPHLLLEDDMLTPTLTNAMAGRASITYEACTTSHRLPAPPTGLRSRGNGTTSRSLSWTAPADDASTLTGYQVRYRTKAAIGATNTLGVPLSDGAWTAPTTQPEAADTSFTIDDLSAGEVYEVQIASVASVNGTSRHGPWSASAEVFVPAPPPPAPTPPPAPPSFDDISGNAYESEINKIAAAGITNGCSATSFCPDRVTTRAEMAAFLDRALNLPQPSATYKPFDDIDNHVLSESIRALAAAGITLGCTTTSFCPNETVTRAQVAAFVTRGWKLQPAPLGAVDLDDIAGHYFALEIQSVVFANVAKACNAAGTRFCPDRLVRRGEAAGFLARAAGL